MSRPLCSLTASVLLLTAAVGGAQETKSYRSTPQERLHAFAWFDTLGYPDVRGLQLVRARPWPYRLGEERHRPDALGFLLAQKGDTFTVLALDLTTRTCTKRNQGAQGDQRFGPEPLALSAVAAAKLAALPEGARHAADVGGYGTERLHLFVLAWACARQGLEREAAELFDRAASLWPRGRTGVAPRSFLQAVADDLADATTYYACAAFSDAAVSRAELLTQFERVARHFPDNEHHKLARETAAVLRRMVAEDADYARRRQAGKPFERLTKTEQVADLIFRLRDQGAVCLETGSLDVLWSRDDKGDTPAHQLVRLGYGAVPQLIEAFDDRRFGRAPGFDRRCQFRGLLTVGECARQILTEITGRRSLKDRADVEIWYEGLLKKGEKRVLIEGTVTGDGDSPEQARRLVERYPDDALPAVTAGAREAKGVWTRSALIRAAAEIPGDSPAAFLIEETRSGPHLEGRVIAAEALHARGRPESVAAMIAEWGRQGPASETWDDILAQWKLVDFLAYCGRVAAVEALGKDLRRRPVDLRLRVLSALGGANSDRPQGAAGKPRDDAKRVRAAAERLFVVALDDREERKGMTIRNASGQSIDDPRVCDVAASSLHALDPKRYPFDLSAPVPERDRAIAGLKSAWRKANGLSRPGLRAADRSLGLIPNGPGLFSSGHRTPRRHPDGSAPAWSGIHAIP